MIRIREFDPDDALQIERCIVELQTFERTIEPNRADPASIAVPYLAHLLQQCQELDGTIFVAESEGAIVGFVCVLGRVDSGSLIEAEREYAYISDLVVLPAQRGQGIGRALLRRAEEYAAQRGAAVLKVDVLAANAVTRAVYQVAGFQENEIRVQKRLKAGHDATPQELADLANRKARSRAAPALETSRLLIRGLEMSDAEAIFEYASDPEVSKYTFWSTHTNIEESRGYIAWLTGDDVVGWAIVHKADRKVIGTCFLHSFSAQHKRAEIAFNLSRRYWNQGYTSEAAREVILAGFDRWGLNRVEGKCTLGNAASARVMIKVGMRFEGVLRSCAFAKGLFHDLRLFAILRDDLG